MGKLYLVSTPIGNLSDISFRACEVLLEADEIVCEDTRRTGLLLKHIKSHFPQKGAISHRFISLNDFNEKAKTPVLLATLLRGCSLALVSDAGSPLFADPGYLLVKLAIAQGIPVEVVPGPSASVAAVQVSGLPPDRVLFWGYLPKRAGQKTKTLEKVRLLSEIEPLTVVFFESPKRIEETLTLIGQIFPSAEVSLCSELTKKFEKVFRGTAEEVSDSLRSTLLKGEFTLVLRP